MSDQHSLSDRILTAYHEAGHAVAAVFWHQGLRSARVLDDRTGQVTMSSVGYLRGGMHVDRAILVHMAGMAVQVGVLKSRDASWAELTERTRGSCDDLRDIADIFSSMSAEEKQRIEKRAHHRLGRWLARGDVWDAIHAVALLLVNHPQGVRGPKCRAVIKMALGRRLSRREREALV